MCFIVCLSCEVIQITPLIATILFAVFLIYLQGATAVFHVTTMKKPQINQDRTPQKLRVNSAKTLPEHCEEPLQNADLVISIVDILVTQWAASKERSSSCNDIGRVQLLTIADIRNELQSRNIFCKVDTIRKTVRKIPLRSQNILLIQQTVRAGKSRAVGYAIRFKNKQDKQ